MKPAAIAFVESNTTGTGRLFAQAAIRLGYQPVVLCADPGRYPFLAEDGIPFVPCDTREADDLLHTIARRLSDRRIDGVYSTSEYFIETAARLAAALGLPGADPRAIRTCRNKACQRERLQGVVALPRFRRVASEDAVSPALREIPPPVIVKPVAGSGSVGVRLCRDADAAAAHARALLATSVNERGLRVVPEVVLEEYVVGPEYSVELLDARVVGVTGKHLSAEPYFVETGHDFPADLPPADERAIRRTAVDAVRAVGLTWGPAHVELRLTTTGPVVIEINPRLAGGFIPELVRLSTGVDLIEETLALVVGARRRVDPVARAHAAIRFIMVPAPGRINDIATGADLETGSVRVQWYRRVGELVRINHDFRDRIGHVMAWAPDPETARRNADVAHRAARVTTHPC